MYSHYSDSNKCQCFFDEEKTAETIQEAQKNISKVIIKQNQIIVKEGELRNSRSNRYFIRIRNVR